MANAENIRSKIKGVFDSLVPATLKTVIQAKGREFFGDFDIPTYPAAVIGLPEISSERETNTQHTRTYTYTVHIFIKSENIADVSDVLDMQEAVLNAFDNDVTLDGDADAGLEPTISAPEPLVTAGTQYIYFSVTIAAKAVQDLSFT